MKLADLPHELVVQMEGPMPDADFESNGITFAPDFIGGADCRPAGHWHDNAYSIGGTEQDRELADYRLFRNLRHCGLTTVLAGIEFRRVRLWGISHFRYDDPPRGWRRLMLYVRCFCNRYARFCGIRDSQ